MPKTPASESVIPLHERLNTRDVYEGPVFWTPEKQVTESEFRARISGLTDRLETAEPDRWVVVCEDGYAFTVGVFAAWQAGAVTVLPPNFKIGTVEDSLTGEEGILTDREDFASLGTSFSPLAFEGDPGALGTMDPDRICIELMTSGSTGKPKVVPMALKHCNSLVANIVKAHHPLIEDFQVDSVVLASVPHQHTWGMHQKILWPLATGQAAHPGQPVYPTDLKRCVLASSGAHLVTSPSTLERLVRSGDLPDLAGKLKGIFSAGDFLSLELAEAIHDQLGYVPVSCYGTTEAGGIAWRRRPPGEENPPWIPYPDVEIRVVDGELQVRSPHVSPTFSEWCSTGDGARPVEGGRFLLGGRRDRTIKVAEKRVSLPEIERRLEESPYVQVSSVLEVNADDPDRRRPELGAAVVLSEEGQDILERSRQELEADLKNVLEPYFSTVALPSHWAFIDQLPRDSMSKVRPDEVRPFFEPRTT